MTHPSGRHIAVLGFFGLLSAAFLLAMLLLAVLRLSRPSAASTAVFYILASAAFALSLAAVSLDMVVTLHPRISEPG